MLKGACIPVDEGYSACARGYRTDTVGRTAAKYYRIVCAGSTPDVGKARRETNVTSKWDKLDMAGGVPLCKISMFLLIHNGNTKDPSPQRSKMIGPVASRLTSSGFPLSHR
jgi:hypothetical protein